MIGVSLPLAWFSENENIDNILSFLKAQGVGSVELRTVRPHHTPETVLQAANTLWDRGLQVTIHGSVSTLASAVEDVFDPLSSLLDALRQDTLNITIHPITDDNVAMLLKLSDRILEKSWPVTIALENNRLLPDKTQGDSVALVLQAVQAANRKNVGICFDMGHYAYYVKKNHPDQPDLLPDPEFWRHVIHTHIHAMNDLRTHFPLGAYELPLDAFLDKLSFEYFGVYNLELDFPRIAPQWDTVPALAQSIPYLRSHLHHCAKLYDTVRESFDRWFTSALRCWESESNTFSLIHASSYLFHTAGCRWAMDIAFRNSRFLAKTPAQVAALFAPLQVMVLSHGHRDHFEESTIRALADNDIIWVVPDFLTERILGLGIPESKLAIAHPGERIHVRGLDILPFESSHYRPDGKGVREYGYHVSAPGCPSLAFPVDIRNFSIKADVPPADYCFAHVWLKDNSIDESSWRPMVEPFAQYMLSFSSKNIFLAHLYEDGRPDNKMWRIEHALAVKKAIAQKSPETNILIPQRGECLRLK